MASGGVGCRAVLSLLTILIMVDGYEAGSLSFAFGSFGMQQTSKDRNRINDNRGDVAPSGGGGNQGQGG